MPIQDIYNDAILLTLKLWNEHDKALESFLDNGTMPENEEIKNEINKIVGELRKIEHLRYELSDVVLALKQRTPNDPIMYNSKKAPPFEQMHAFCLKLVLESLKGSPANEPSTVLPQTADIHNKTHTLTLQGILEASFLSELGSSLESNTSLTTLEIIKSSSNDSNGQELAQLLSKLCKSVVTSLNLGSNNFGATEAKAIADALKTNTTLKSLDLSSNQIGDAGAKHIANKLVDRKPLTKLDLNNNQIGAEGAKAIADALETNTTLESLDLNNNQIGYAGAKHIAEALKDNKTIKSLSLGYNRIGDDGAKAIVEVLIEKKTIKVLNLGKNQIGIQSAQYIANALRVNKTLTELNLTNNQIGDEGAKHIANALRVNKTLTELDLRHNQIGDEGVGALANALASNGAIKTISLIGNNNISSQAKETFAEITKGNTTILSAYGVDDTNTMQHTLLRNRMLKLVDLSYSTALGTNEAIAEFVQNYYWAKAHDVILSDEALKMIVDAICEKEKDLSPTEPFDIGRMLKKAGIEQAFIGESNADRINKAVNEMLKRTPAPVVDSSSLSIESNSIENHLKEQTP